MTTIDLTDLASKIIAAISLAEGAAYW